MHPFSREGIYTFRTNRFYEKLAEITKDAKAKGDLVIIGGDWNASIRHNNAPNLIGKCASHKEGENSDSLVNFMLEQKMAAMNTFQQAQWRSRYTWSRGASKSMIDFFLVPEFLIRWHFGKKKQGHQVEHAERPSRDPHVPPRGRERQREEEVDSSEEKGDRMPK